MIAQSTFVRIRRSAGLMALTLVLAACQTPAHVDLRQPSPPAPALYPAGQNAHAVQRVDVGLGLYEIQALDADTLVAAASPSFEKGASGALYFLDAQTLAVKDTVNVPRRSFAVGINRRTQTIYVGNTLDGSLTVVDATTRAVTGTIQLGRAGAKGDVPHTRKVIVDEARNRVFVTSPGDAGKVWIIDGQTRQVRHTLNNLGRWTAGAAYDAQSDRLYVGQGGTHEILAIDPTRGRVVQRLSTGDTTDARDAKHFMLNVALDSATQRLFATDSNTNRLYVFDLRTGKAVQQVPLGKGALDVRFNAVRQEIYVTNRGAGHGDKSGTGALTMLDANNYAVKRTVDLPVHPNSLALDDTGQVLFVTVKAPLDRNHPSYREGALDSVVRVPLNN